MSSIKFDAIIAAGLAVAPMLEGVVNLLPQGGKAALIVGAFLKLMSLLRRFIPDTKLVAAQAEATKAAARAEAPAAARAAAPEAARAAAPEAAKAARSSPPDTVTFGREPNGG